MTTTHLPQAEWTRRDSLARLVAALGAEDIRWVGGCVRDTLLGHASNDFSAVRFATSKRRPLFESDNDAEVRYDLDRIYPKMKAGIGLPKAGRAKISAADLNRSPGCVYDQNVISFRSGHMGSDFGRSAGRNGAICDIDASHI